MTWNSQLAAACIQHGQQLRAEKLALYSGGRAEVVFNDGSACILHPPHAERATYFRADGARSRILTSCAPRLCRANSVSGGGDPRLVDDQVRAKVTAAVKLRNSLHVVPSLSSLDSEGCDGSHLKLWRHERLSHVLWPGRGEANVRVLGTGAIEVEAVDAVAKLTLAPHAQTYTVEWYCATSAPCKIEHKLLPSQPESADDDRQGADGRNRLFVAPCDGVANTGALVVGVSYEHTLQVQYLSARDIPPAAWSYPLLQALELWREHQPSTFAAHDALVTSVDAVAQRNFATSRVILTASKEVSAPLPLPSSEEDALLCGSGSSNSFGKDAVSPTVALGSDGEGPVRVVWQPDATIWLHSDRSEHDRSAHLAFAAEATIDVSVASGPRTDVVERALFVSKSGGRFWTRLGAHGEPSDLLCSAVLPLDSASSQSSKQMAEASRWLEQNRMEMELRGFAAKAHVVERKDCIQTSDPVGTEHLSGWILKREVSETGVGRLSLFQPACPTPTAADGQRFLVRVLFADNARMEFSVAAFAHGRSLSMPTEMDCFRLLTPQGEILQRSFGTPLSCEEYVRFGQKLLEVAAIDKVEQRRQRTVAEAVRAQAAAYADVERRRSATLLLQQGAATAALLQPLSDHFETGLGSSAPSSLPFAGDCTRSCGNEDVIAQALRRTREARLGIEQTLNLSASV